MTGLVSSCAAIAFGSERYNEACDSLELGDANGEWSLSIRRSTRNCIDFIDAQLCWLDHCEFAEQVLDTVPQRLRAPIAAARETPARRGRSEA